ncbi:hypothetical protein QUF70_01630 [Desulfobacterales bacterium HSG17]|nr:hypothetical protein [Desulfobacterales bacterium HSG17]
MKKRFILLPVIFLVLITGKSQGAELGGIDIHGFISQGYLKSDDNNFLAETEDGSFQFNEIGINFGRQLTDKLHLGLQLFARDQGKIGNDEIVVDWAYADYHWKDWMGIRAGIMRVAHGLYNETRDIDMLRTSILLPQSIYTETQRDAYSRMQGAGLYGEIILNAFGSLSYQMAIGTINVDEDGGIARQIEDNSMGNVENIDVGVFYNGSLQWNSPFEGFRVGVTGVKTTDMETKIQMDLVMGPPGTPSTSMTVVSDTPVFETAVFSAEYTWNDLMLSLEYMYMHVENVIEGITPVMEQTPEGYYARASYRFSDWFELGTYYSVFYIDKDDRDGENYTAMGQPDYRAWLKDWALSAKFDINEFWTAKMEIHRMNGAALQFSMDNPDGNDEDWYLMAAKLTFSF